MIKKLDIEYLDKIMDLHEKTIFPVWESFGRNYDVTKVKDFVENIFQEGEVYGYFLDDKLLGGLALGEEEGKGWIEFILIIPEFQGKGISKKLMDFSEDYFLDKGINVIGLDVVIKNQRAVNFYKKIDYRVIKEFNKNNVLKYIMEKKLS